MTVDDQLVALWSAGATQDVIAREFRTTRNVLAGVVARARKSGDARFPLRAALPRGGRKPKPAASICKPVVAPSRESSAKPAPVSPPAGPPPEPKSQSAGLPLWQLESRDCRFALNSPEKGVGEYLFCGAPAVPGRPYCGRHASSVKGATPKPMTVPSRR